MRLITGSGGGGGKDGGGSGRVAQEDSDNLQSKSYAQVLDLVSEGEIEGLVYGLRSVFLDGTPLMAEDGT
jgi:predicted phage tail protein